MKQLSFTVNLEVGPVQNHLVVQALEVSLDPDLEANPSQKVSLEVFLVLNPEVCLDLVLNLKVDLDQKASRILDLSPHLKADQLQGQDQDREVDQGMFKKKLFVFMEYFSFDFNLQKCITFEI